GRIAAEVRDAEPLSGLAGDAHADRVHAVRRQHAAAREEVRRREADRRTAPVAAPDFSLDDVEAAEQLRRRRDVTGAEEAADRAAADRVLALVHRGHDFDVETVPRAELDQELRRPPPVPSEVDV